MVLEVSRNPHHSPLPGQGLSSRTANQADRELGHPLPVGRGKGEGPLCAALFLSVEPQNFDAWRPSYSVTAPGAEVPHPALRAGLSCWGELIKDPSSRKSTVSGQGTRHLSEESQESGNETSPAPQCGEGTHPRPESGVLVR
jgi:hypothetical protein